MDSEGDVRRSIVIIVNTQYANTVQRCRKDFLIGGGGGAQYVFVVQDI